MSRPATEPQPSPAGNLLRLARGSRRLSIRQAAKLAGVSETHWRHVESGSESKAGMRLPIGRIKADKLAHMAHAVGLGPERLEAEGGRPDAAEILREILRAQAAQPGPAAQFPPLPTLRESGWPRRSYGELDHLAQTLADIPGLEEAEAEGVIRMTAESIRSARAAAGEERRGALSEASGS